MTIDSNVIIRTHEMSLVDREIMKLIFNKVRDDMKDSEWHDYNGVIVYKMNPLQVEVVYRFIYIDNKLHWQLKKFEHKEPSKIIKPKFIHYSKGEH